MEPVSNIDRVVILLKQRLDERSRAARKSGAGEALAQRATGAATGLGALAALGGVDDRQLRRTFIQTLLADQFGDGLINDAQFQQVVTRVSDAIESDKSAAALVSRLVTEIRGRAVSAPAAS